MVRSGIRIKQEATVAVTSAFALKADVKARR